MLIDMKEFEICQINTHMLKYFDIYDIHPNYAITMNIVEICLKIMNNLKGLYS